MTRRLTPDRLRWPLSVIDFEASHLGRLSYPIEVGCCRWDGPDHAAVSWSTLISIDPAWRRNGIWNPESQRIHGIRREALRNAPTPSQAMCELNDFLGVGAVAHCDGGSHDAYWLQRLETAADLRASFTMGSLGTIRGSMDDEQKDRLDQWGRDHQAAHRARSDAEDHVRAFAFAMGLEEVRILRA